MSIIYLSESEDIRKEDMENKKMRFCINENTGKLDICITDEELEKIYVKIG